MASRKNAKKAKKPLAIRVIKIIVIALSCAVLLAAIAERTIHFYRHVTK